MKLDEILAAPEGVEKTARLAAWVQGLFGRGLEPVLVGGAAVELYTAGDYTTGDLDMVGTVPAAVAAALVREGFVRRGRHWIHEAGQVYLEFAGSALADGESAVRIEIAGCEVVAIAPEASWRSAWVRGSTGAPRWTE